jgi:hypothetical protein
MGVASGCKCIIDAVLFFLLRKIIDYLGHVPTISLGLVGHIAVFFICSLTTSPCVVILIEIIHATFYGFLVSTCAYFLDQSVPAGSDLRLQGMYHLIISHYSSSLILLARAQNIFNCATNMHFSSGILTYIQ